MDFDALLARASELRAEAEKNARQAKEKAQASAQAVAVIDAARIAALIQRLGAKGLGYCTKCRGTFPISQVRYVGERQLISAGGGGTQLKAMIFHRMCEACWEHKKDHSTERSQFMPASFAEGIFHVWEGEKWRDLTFEEENKKIVHPHWITEKMAEEYGIPPSLNIRPLVP